MPLRQRKLGKPHIQHAARHRARARRAPAWMMVLVLLLGLVSGVVGGWFWAQTQSPALPVTGLAPLTQDEARLLHQEELTLARSELSIREGELAVERAARQRLEAQLAGLQRDLGAERDRLAFFEQLLPPGPGGAVDIRSASFERFGSALQYRVLLMRHGKEGSSFQGSLRFMASGLDRGQAATRELKPMQGGRGGAAGDEDAALSSALNFDQYLSAKGVLWIPVGFTPDAVTVQVLEGEVVKAAYRVELPAPEADVSAPPPPAVAQ